MLGKLLTEHEVQAHAVAVVVVICLRTVERKHYHLTLRKDVANGESTVRKAVVSRLADDSAPRGVFLLLFPTEAGGKDDDDGYEKVFMMGSVVSMCHIFNLTQESKVSFQFVSGEQNMYNV